MADMASKRKAIVHRKKVVISLLIFTLIWVTGGCLSFISWTHFFGNPVKVTLVQGNIPQDLKWSSDEAIPTLNRYKELSANHWDSQLVIWPEAAIPLILQDATEFLEEMHTTAKQHHAAFITGIPIKDEIKAKLIIALKVLLLVV